MRAALLPLQRPGVFLGLLPPLLPAFLPCQHWALILSSLIKHGLPKKQQQQKMGTRIHLWGILALEGSWRETHHTNTPFKVRLRPWTDHSGHHQRPESGAFAPFRTAASQSSVNVPRSPACAAAQVPRALGNLTAGLEI